MYVGCTKDVPSLGLADPDFSFEFRFGSGTGTRTLNLAVNRSLLPVQNPRFVFAQCRRVSSNAMACHWRCCTPAGGCHPVF